MGNAPGDFLQRATHALSLAGSLSAADWVSCVHALRALFQARLTLSRQKDGELLRLLSQIGPARKAPEIEPESITEVEQIGRAISRVAILVPWRSDCLVQAIAADSLLRQHGFQSEFFLGVQRRGDAAFLAHCWIKCGDQVAVGGTSDDFKVLTCSGDILPRQAV